jgi:gas vesicle protein
MTERYDEGVGSGGFLSGLVVGTALGAAAAMLFAPKPGWEMRRDLADTAGDLGQAAKDRWEDVSEGVASAVDKGRETYDQAVGTVRQVADDAGRSVDGAKDAVKKVADTAARGTMGSASVPKPAGVNR